LGTFPIESAPEAMDKEMKTRHVILLWILVLPIAAMGFLTAVEMSNRHLHIQQAIAECHGLAEEGHLKPKELICELEHYDARMMGGVYVRITKNVVAVSYNGGWRYQLGFVEGKLLYPFNQDTN